MGALEYNLVSPHFGYTIDAYVREALFVYSEKGSDFIQPMADNGLGVEVESVAFDTFIQDPHLQGASHLVAAGPLPTIKAIMKLACAHELSMGILPLPHQKVLCQSYDIPAKTDEKIDLALRREHQTIDLLYCNDELVLFKASFGKVPLWDTPVQTGLTRRLIQSVGRLAGIRLFGFDFRVGGGQRLRTAATAAWWSSTRPVPWPPASSGTTASCPTA